MPPVNAKNLGLSAAADLGIGMGDLLQSQLADESAEARRKRRLQDQQQSMEPGVASSMLLGGGMGGGRGY